MFYVGEKFDIQKNKEYKTLDGAKKAALKKNFCVFNEVGVEMYSPKMKLTDKVPEGVTEDSRNGILTVYNKNKKKVREVPNKEIETESILSDDVTEEDSEETAKDEELEEEDQEEQEETEDSVKEVNGRIRRVFQGKLRLRRKPSMEDSVICGVTMFEEKRAVRKHTVRGVVMYETSDGYFISGEPAHVEFIPD